MAADTAPIPPLWSRWLRSGSVAAMDLLFPPQCTFCGSECPSQGGQPLWCEACQRQLVATTRPACPRCAMPCPEHDAATGPCPHCRGLKLRYDQARSVNQYQGPLREAVLKCKHARYEALAAGLGWQLAQRLKALPFDPPPELVVPVPMFWLQRLWRGANSAESMAIAAAAELALPVATDLLVCRRFLRKQATLRPNERRKNVRHAFRVSWRHSIRGARLLVIDDVMTTGATAQETARVLCEAGAAAVYVAAVARGMGQT
jgi:ComF family protein